MTINVLWTIYYISMVKETYTMPSFSLKQIFEFVLGFTDA